MFEIVATKDASIVLDKVYVSVLIEYPKPTLLTYTSEHQRGHASSLVCLLFEPIESEPYSQPASVTHDYGECLAYIPGPR